MILRKTECSKFRNEEMEARIGKQCLWKPLSIILAQDGKAGFKGDSQRKIGQIQHKAKQSKQEKWAEIK